ncbi:TonB-dependent receptor family protein [Leptospira ilyithenensis]|uniref:TonB-dependent receptor n=1 Tax=Leptospira ilyithenensis TaxID=2484901 RepID=A0A4R9LPU2_9LEPT|nr:TonB-dependent receptor [Leptospira ilyithenensis]TGN10107.1 TonB-dependent receptor [Leptospira ilyithenensis]
MNLKSDSITYFISVCILTYLLSFSVFAQTEKPEDADEKEKQIKEEPGIKVIGSKEKDLAKVPGSATVISKKYLEETNPIDPLETLRRVPGASVRFQDAAGLTPNIGFRGVSNEETRKTLILEDGLPVSLSPYGQPETYYFPSIERAERVEIIKGSGSILFGPSTIGGIINIVTRKPPVEPKFQWKSIGGANGYLSNLLRYGGTFGKLGIDTTVFRKSGDGYRDHQSFQVNEFDLKLRYTLDNESAFTFRLQSHEQKAESTYLGLSQGLYQKNTKINPAVFDEKKLSRIATVIGWETSPLSFIKGGIRTYGNQASRDWGRQDYLFDNTTNGGYLPPPGDTLGVYTPSFMGTRPGDTIYMRETYGQRNQDFQIFGLDGRGEFSFKTKEILHEIDFGARAHGEKNQNRLYLSKTKDYQGWITRRNLLDDFTGASAVDFIYKSANQDLTNNQLRKIEAYSVFLQDRIHINKNFRLIPGIRREDIRQTTFTTRRSPSPSEQSVGFVYPGVSWIDTNESSMARTNIWLPGIGFVHKLVEKTDLFGGVHKAFSPPTFSSGFDPYGRQYNLRPETSTNYETGIRSKLPYFVRLETAIYKMFFRDQIINTNEANSELGARPANTGYSIHQGLEFSLGWDMGKTIQKSWSLEWEFIYSKIDARSKSTPNLIYSTDYNGNLIYDTRPLFVTEGNNTYSRDTRGNVLPYVSRDSGAIALAFSHPKGFFLRNEFQYVGKQFSDLENTENETPSGSRGIIPEYWLWNISSGYKPEGANWSLFITAKNVTDKRYVSGRLPIGIQPGTFRQINIGFSIEL